MTCSENAVKVTEEDKLPVLFAEKVQAVIPSPASFAGVW